MWSLPVYITFHAVKFRLELTDKNKLFEKFVRCYKKIDLEIIISYTDYLSMLDKSMSEAEAGGFITKTIAELEDYE